MKTLSCLAILALFLLGAGEDIQAKDSHINNIVLVHGAWADGSGWKGVYDILAKKGYHVSIVQDPETSFEADVTAENFLDTSRFLTSELRILKREN